MKYIKKWLGDVWCAIVHDIIQSKHKVKEVHRPTIIMKCEKCGREWDLIADM